MSKSRGERDIPEAETDKLQPMGQTWPAAWFCKYSPAGGHTCSNAHDSTMAAFAVQRQSEVVLREITWPFVEKVYRPGD